MYKRLLLAIIITSFIGPFAGSGLSVAIPAIGREFVTTAEMLSYVVFAFLLGSAMFVLPIGRVADIYGRRKIYTIGLWLFAGTFLLAGIAPNIESLVAMRFLQGAVMSMIFGPGMALLVSTVKKEEQGKAIGYSAAATYSGLSMGPVICGFLCELLGWRSIFFLTGAVVCLSIYLIRGVQEEWYGGRNEALDLKGSLCFLLAAPMILLGLSEFSESGYGVWLLLAGILGVMAFGYIEYKSSSPCLDVKAFKSNKAFIMSNLVAMLHYSGTFAISFLMSVYLQVICGLSASYAGGIILLQPVMMAVLSPMAGSLSDRVHPGKVAAFGMALTCSGLFGLSLLDMDSSLLRVGVNLLWIGIGFAFFSSPNNNAIMRSIEAKYYGTASSLLATMRLFGQSISMAMVTMLLAANGVSSMLGEDNIQLMSTIQMCFRLFAFFSIMGIGMCLVRNKNKIGRE